MLSLDDSLDWDTSYTGNTFDIDSIHALVTDLNENWAWYNLVGLYLAMGNTTEAENVLSGITYRTSEQEEEYNDYVTIYEILKDMQTEERNALTSGESTALTEIAAYESSNGAKVLAQNLLNVHHLLDPAVPQIACGGVVSDPEERPRPLDPMQPVSILGKDKFISAAPNPASDKVTFTYDVPAAKGLQLTITTVPGQVIAKFDLTANKGVHTWDTGNTAPGSYVYKLSDSRGVITTGKLVIVK